MRLLLQMVGMAVAAVLLAQTVEWNRDGVVSFFVNQTRVDISLNHFLLLCLLVFALAYSVLRLWGVIFRLPERAGKWRQQQRLNLVLTQLIDGLEHSFAGRYVRAHKVWQPLLRHEKVAPVAHLLCAAARHAVQDAPGREAHMQAVMDLVLVQPEPVASAQNVARTAAVAERELVAQKRKSEVLEGAMLLQAEWAERAGLAQKAMRLLQQLPAGSARRTPALRQKLRLHQALQQYEQALETARLLARHRAFGAEAAQSLLSSLIRQVMAHASDGEKLAQFWQSLTRAEQERPQLLISLAHNYARLTKLVEAQDVQRLLTLAIGSVWPLWQQYYDLPPGLKMQFCQVLMQCRAHLQADSLKPIEEAATSYSRDAAVQCLAGLVTQHLGLPGKAMQYLQRAQYLLRTDARDMPAARSAQVELQQRIWQALAELAEQAGDTDAALQAWKQAALQHTQH